MVGRIPVMNISPVIELGRLPAKATIDEPFPVRANVFREGHDHLAAEVVLIDPSGTRRGPVPMTKRGDAPDYYEAWVTPDRTGAWKFEIQAWSDPIATWQHNAGVKVPAGVDVELMFTEATLLIDRILVEYDGDLTSKERALLDTALEAAGDTGDRGDPTRPGWRCCRTPTWTGCWPTIRCGS